MPCYRPNQGYWSRAVHPRTGNRFVVFNKQDGFVDLPVKVPCGQCVGCRLKRSRDWAIRCIHEASLWKSNCFITLTYNNEFLPEDHSLHHEDFQKFMKRLRKRFGEGIRYYMCGEYGSQYGRPHYHAVLFNHDFIDKNVWMVKRDIPIYVSQALKELWPFGFSTVGDVTFESAAYVARYIMKKITGEIADDHYEWINPETGEIFRRKPEYCQPSRNGGIGRGWFEKYGKEVYPDDFVIVKGKRLRPPRFYDKIVQLEDPELFTAVKRDRVATGKSQAWNSTRDRLVVREKVQLAKLDLLKREIE